MVFGSHSVEPWSMNSRLSQSTILNVLQDKAGMLWIVNLDGITRFDGKQFINYRTYKSGEGHTPSVNIVKVIENFDGLVLAVSRDAGLLKYDKHTNSFTKLKFDENSPLLNSRLSDAHADNEGLLWIGYEDGSVSRINFRLQQSKHFPNLFSSRVNSFSSLHKNGVQAASIGGEIISIGDKNTNDPRYFDISSFCNKDISDVVDISTINESLTLVGTRGNGLYLVNFSSKLCTRIKLSLANNSGKSEPYIHQIHFDSRSGLIWIATDQGIYQIDELKRVIHLDSSNSNLSNDETIFISSGTGNILWIGTYKGLNYLLPTQFQSFTAKSFNELGSLVSIDNLSEHELLIASYDGLISFNKLTKNHSTLKFSHPEMNFLDEKIMSIHTDSTGIWVGYRSAGLEHFGRKTKAITRFKKESISSNSVSAVLTTSSGDTLIGTHGGGLSHLAESGEVKTYSVGNNRVIMITEGTDGALWISTESGLHELNLALGMVEDINLAHLSDESTSTSSPLIWEMTETLDGDFWLGSVHHGVFFWSRNDYIQRDFGIECIPGGHRRCSR